MRVLYLTDSLSDLDGVGRYAVRLVAALEAELAAAGERLEVEVLLARRHRPTSDAVPAHWRVRVGLPPDHFYRMSSARFWPSLAHGVWTAARAARRADLVHAIKDYPHSLVALCAARLAGKPCVATGHGTYTVQPLVDRRHARLARWTYRRFAALVCVSGFTRRRLFEELGPGVLDPARVPIVPNAVSAEHYGAPRALGERPWHAHPFTLGMGELKERKGHHLALAAFARVAAPRPALHHWIVGRRHGDAYQARLERQVADAGLAERVHFLGNVSEDEKVDLLQRARVFVHTPVTSAEGGFEGFGIVYLEAAAAGTPSVGTRGSGAEDAVVDGTSGRLVDPTAEAVAAAIAELVDDEAARAALGARAREHARGASWAANARAVLGVYREALA